MSDRNDLRIAGKARVDKKTKNLNGRLQRGDIAVINHEDLDSTCARMLVERKVAAVINAAPSISGRYPNTGPSILLNAGIPILDDVGIEVMTRIREGENIRIEQSSVMRGDEEVSIGTLLSEERINQLTEESRNYFADELQKFAENTLKYIQEEKLLILDPVEVPDLWTNW